MGGNGAGHLASPPICRLKEGALPIWRRLAALQLTGSGSGARAFKASWALDSRTCAYTGGAGYTGGFYASRGL